MLLYLDIIILPIIILICYLETNLWLFKKLKHNIMIYYSYQSFQNVLNVLTKSETIIKCLRYIFVKYIFIMSRNSLFYFALIDFMTHGWRGGWSNDCRAACIGFDSRTEQLFV